MNWKNANKFMLCLIHSYFHKFSSILYSQWIISHAGNCVMLFSKARMLNIKWSPSLRMHNLEWWPFATSQKFIHIGIKSIHNIIYFKSKNLHFLLFRKMSSSSSFPPENKHEINQVPQPRPAEVRTWNVEKKNNF